MARLISFAWFPAFLGVPNTPTWHPSWSAWGQ